MYHLKQLLRYILKYFKNSYQQHVRSLEIIFSILHVILQDIYKAR